VGKICHPINIIKQFNLLMEELFSDTSTKVKNIPKMEEKLHKKKIQWLKLLAKTQENSYYNILNIKL